MDQPAGAGAQPRHQDRRRGQLGDLGDGAGVQRDHDVRACSAAPGRAATCPADRSRRSGPSRRPRTRAAYAASASLTCSGHLAAERQGPDGVRRASRPGWPRRTPRRRSDRPSPVRRARPARLRRPRRTSGAWATRLAGNGRGGTTGTPGRLVAIERLRASSVPTAVRSGWPAAPGRWPPRSRPGRRAGAARSRRRPRPAAAAGPGRRCRAATCRRMTSRRISQARAERAGQREQHAEQADHERAAGEQQHRAEDQGRVDGVGDQHVDDGGGGRPGELRPRADAESASGRRCAHNGVRLSRDRPMRGSARGHRGPVGGRGRPGGRRVTMRQCLVTVC